MLATRTSTTDSKLATFTANPPVQNCFLLSMAAKFRWLQYFFFGVDFQGCAQASSKILLHEKHGLLAEFLASNFLCKGPPERGQKTIFELPF